MPAYTEANGWARGPALGLHDWEGGRKNVLSKMCVGLPDLERIHI